VEKASREDARSGWNPLYYYRAGAGLDEDSTHLNYDTTKVILMTDADVRRFSYPHIAVDLFLSAYAETDNRESSFYRPTASVPD